MNNDILYWKKINNVNYPMYYNVYNNKNIINVIFTFMTDNVYI